MKMLRMSRKPQKMNVAQIEKQKQPKRKPAGFSANVLDG